jgi:uncharacterized membrane protein YkoI
MRRITSYLTVAAFLLVGVIALAADDKPEKIAADKIPAKIKATIEGRLPGAEVTSCEKETEDGKVVYDCELKQKGRKYEMDILEDGTLMEIEKEIEASKLPEAGTKAIAAKYPKSTIKEVMEVNKVEGKKETPINYEITIETADKKEEEVLLNLDGTIKVEEKKAEEKK